jgi:hypothetical protein
LKIRRRRFEQSEVCGAVDQSNVTLCKRLLFVFFVLAVLGAREQAYAQFTEAHNYDNTPVGTNQLELAYAYGHSDTSLDTSLIVAGARLNLNQGSIDYTHYFSFAHRLVWANASLPIAGLSGSVSGTNISGSNTGTGDSSYELAALLKGGPALSVAQFENYKPTTIIGASLSISAPTGKYDTNRILNLGSNRWAFKPEIALSHPFGHEQKWEFDAYANAEFYTNDTSYHGREILRQQPLPGVEGHISYSFTNSLWASLDTRYCFRGTTSVNDVNQNNAQKNFTLGSEVNVSLNSKNSLAFEFAKALVHENSAAYTGFAVKYNYTWRKGYQ